MKYIPKQTSNGKWSLYNIEKKEYSKIIFKSKETAISQANNRVKIKKPIITLELTDEEISESEEEPMKYGEHEFTQEQIELIIKTLIS